MNKRNNTDKWKKRFLILCIANIVVLVIFAVFIYSPIPKTELELASESYKSENSSEFVVRTTKQNVNNLVNAYLDKLLPIRISIISLILMKMFNYLGSCLFSQQRSRCSFILSRKYKKMAILF